jgi:prevent-host-death family protein
MQVAVRELRNHTKSVLDAVERGEQVVLTRMGEPVALITPINQSSNVGEWLDDLMADAVADTGWLDEVVQGRRDDEAADRRRDFE